MKVNGMKILCIGGGNAMPDAVITGLRGKADITTIATMTDSGGSSGKLRQEFGVLPPGDIRRHLLALSKAPEWKKSMFRLRFGSEDVGGGHKGHSLGNLIIASIEKDVKNYDKTLDILHDFLEIDGKCLPCITENADLCAELESGEIIRGETEIDMPTAHDPMLRIRRVFLAPPVKAYVKALEALAESDVIIIGPGDLFSSIIPCFLPSGMKESFEKTKAKKIFICPAMTKHGETDEFSVTDFVNEIEKYAGKMDFIVYNTEVPDFGRIEKYKKDEPSVCEIVGSGKGLDGKKFLGQGLLIKSGKIIYDPQKLSRLILDVSER
jgi:uncharacterized cofD-like protein